MADAEELANSSGSVTDLGVFVYEVDFGRNISACAYIVTQGEAGLGGEPGGIVGAAHRAGNAEAAYVTIRTEANASSTVPSTWGWFASAREMALATNLVYGRDGAAARISTGCG